MSSSSPKKPIACYCNNITSDEVIAWCDSQDSLNKESLAQLQKDTSAGNGPCGGSCQAYLRQLVSSFSDGLYSSTEEGSPPLPSEFIRAISLFNRRYYWETHEVLEDLWMDEVGKVRTFYQAIIQGAAALYHVLNANPRGVIKLSQDSLAKIEGPQENPWRINLSPLISALNSYKTQAEEILGSSREGFDYTLLPKIKISPRLKVES